MDEKFYSYHKNVIPKELAERCIKVFSPKNEYFIEKDKQPLFSFFSNPSGKEYKYFKRDVVGIEFPDELKEISLIASSLIKEKHLSFDIAFVNFYRNGKDHITPHRDKTHGIENPIVSFSIYQDLDNTEEKDLRTLQIKYQPMIGFDDQEESNDKIIMENDSAIIMKVGMQQRYLHWVPETDSSKFRINITMRAEN